MCSASDRDSKNDPTLQPGSLPDSLYRAEQVRALDRAAIDDHGIPGLTLMHRAGAVGLGCLQRHWPLASRILVVTGLGNNAGDGFVIARLAAEAGLNCSVLALGDSDRLQGDALSAWREIPAGVTLVSAHEATLETAFQSVDVIVDAILGTGIDRPVEGLFRSAIEAVNASGLPVISMDTPSGLNVDTGRIMGVAVRAQITVTLIGVKQGLLTGQGPACCGRLIFDDLGVPEAVYQSQTSAALRCDWQRLGHWLQPRARDSHKGSFGHVLVIGGARGFAGAARMTAEAAARSGAGLTSLATDPGHASLVSMACPVIMSHGVRHSADLHPVLGKASVAAIGPGLGTGDWGMEMLAPLLEWNGPMVLDADALNLLAREPAQRQDWILTPHPGEAARLLQTDSATIEQDRFAAVAELQQRYGGVVVLKGAGSLIADGDSIHVCADGNPGMASGGMGDVLTGVIAALVAQGLDLSRAARLGVCVHAAAADRVAVAGERGMLATDVIAMLRTMVNPPLPRC